MPSTNYTPQTPNSTGYTASSVSTTNYQLITLLLANDSTVLANSTVYNALGQDTTDPTIYNTINYTEA